MEKLKEFVSEQIKTIIPDYEKVELEASVTSSAFSVEFFATVDGRKMQCFQMIDEEMFTEKEFNKFSKAFVDYVRSLPEFDMEHINRYDVKLKKK